MISNKTNRRDVSVEFAETMLAGILALPPNAKGIVIFAHGSGSSRLSPRNQYVAELLKSREIATLLFDLLTIEEEIIDQQTSQLRFDVGLLTERLIGATRWAIRYPETQGMEIAYFGASTGAAAALMAAAQLPDIIAAVVSRGGRPDLAGEALTLVRAPTLLIVGGNDEPVITLNRQALAELHCREKKMVIVPGATHLFEEPGTLTTAASVAADWFSRYFALVGKSRVRKIAQTI